MSGNFQNEIDIEMMERAHYLRYAYFENLETHLRSLEDILIEHKVNVRWAIGEERLCSNILDLLPNKNYNKVCVDMPYIPASLQQDVDNVLKIYNVEEVANHQNEVETLLVNADFAIAENGSLVFLNRASKDCFNLIKNLIVVVNIDQVIVSQSDLSLFMNLKCGYQSHVSDVKIISGSFSKIVADEFLSSDASGFNREPVSVSVIFYENNVSVLLEDVSIRQSLYCINCGRCKEVCPVARYSKISPIEIVKQNCISKFSDTQSIFKQTTLCGNCAELCPVKVPLTDILTYEMNLVNGYSLNNKSRRLFSILSKRGKLNKYNKPILKWFFVKYFFGKNKMLATYLDAQRDSFYNLIRNTPDKEEDEKLRS